MTKDRKKQYDKTYMKMATVLSELSYCVKKKVGAILVKDNKIIATGFNGSPAKMFPNNCEDEVGKTLWHTIHAESNAITSVAASTQTCQGSTMYITCSPCKDCSKLIYQSGVIRVVYKDFYKDLDGVDFLRSAGVEVEQENKIYDLKVNEEFTIDLISDFLQNEHYPSLDSFLADIPKDCSEKTLISILEMTKFCKTKLKNRHRLYANLLLKFSNQNVDYSIISHLE